MVKYDNKNWFKLLLTLKGSIAKTIFFRVILFSATAGGIVAIDKYLLNMTIASSTPWTIVGVALGLMLVFRTNSSYDRYWEGRKLWGNITNSSTQVAIGVVSIIPTKNEESLVLKKKLMNLTIAFPYLVKEKLRDSNDISEVKNILDIDDLAVIQNSNNKPVACMTLIWKYFYKCKEIGILSESLMRIFDGKLTDLINNLGNCERIKSTPVPIAYVLHLKRFLYLFCLTVPLAFVDAFGWWSILVAALVSYSFIGIEEIGVEIEDPFGKDANDLPLDETAKSIQETLKELQI